jgi:hypothetical protein
MELLTLYAERITETRGLFAGFKKTILRNEKGEIVSTYPAGSSQPSKNRKTIIHNCFTYNLKWVEQSKSTSSHPKIKKLILILIMALILFSCNYEP